MKKVFLELLDNGFFLVPLRGKGKDVKECKRPLAFKQGDEIITWKNPEILSYAEDLARKGHEAFGIWTRASRILGIDIDLYKINDPQMRNKIYTFIREAVKKHAYIELTASRGVHVAFQNPDEKLYLAGEGQVEVLYDKIMIIAPTRFRTPSGIHQYKIMYNTLPTCSLVEEAEDVLGLIGIVPGSITIGSVTTSDRGDRVRFSMYLASRMMLDLDIDSLSDTQISLLLYILFAKADCYCLAQVMEEIIKSKTCPIRKEVVDLKNPRTSRFIIQHVFTSILALLGASAERIHSWLHSWRFVDEDLDPREDSPKSAITNVFRYMVFNLVPLPCPFAKPLRLPPCDTVPILKIARLGKEKIMEAYNYVKQLKHLPAPGT